MNTRTLGSGLEMFNNFMDVEAEATVSIKSEDDMDSSDMSSEATEVTEANIADEEKSGNDVNTATDNIESAEKVMSHALDELYSTYAFINVGKKYGVSSSLMDYMNRHSNLSGRWRSMGIFVSGMEAEEGAGEKSLLDKAKSFGSKIWETIKKWFIKIKEFFIQLGKTIWSKLTGQKKRLEVINKAIDEAPDTVEYLGEISNVKVPVYDRIINAINDCRTIINDSFNYTDSKKVDEHNAKIDWVKRVLGESKPISQQSNLTKKSSLKSLFELVGKQASPDEIKNKTEAAAKKIDEYKTKADEASKNNGDVEQFKTLMEASKKERQTLLEAIKLESKLIDLCIYLGNLFMRAAKLTKEKADTGSEKKANENYNIIMKSVDRMTYATEASVGHYAGKSKDKIVEWAKRIWSWITGIFDKVVQWFRDKFGKVSTLNKKLDSITVSNVDFNKYSGKLAKDKILDYDDIEKFLSNNKSNIQKVLDDKINFSDSGYSTSSETRHEELRKARNELMQKKDLIENCRGYQNKNNVKNAVKLFSEVNDIIKKLETVKKNFKSDLDKVTAEAAKDEYMKGAQSDISKRSAIIASILGSFTTIGMSLDRGIDAFIKVATIIDKKNEK